MNNITIQWKNCIICFLFMLFILISFLYIDYKVKEIKYTNGTYLCSGSNPNINWNVVKGQTSFIIVLSDGTQMTARVS